MTKAERLRQHHASSDALLEARDALLRIAEVDDDAAVLAAAAAYRSAHAEFRLTLAKWAGWL